MKLEATFVTSAAGPDDFPRDGLREVAFVGRSNVGKSSLINALARHRIARTSAAPGKTRLANVYRVVRGNSEPLYFVDLPGYGYARGGGQAAAEFRELTRTYFAAVREEAETAGGRRRVRLEPDREALLLVDSRHPGLDSDRAAWAWLRNTVDAAAIVSTKIDKLARGERIRAMREFESVFEHPVLPVSAVTGEGLDELWTLIDRLANSRPNNRNKHTPLNPHHSSPRRTPGATAERPPKR